MTDLVIIVKVKQKGMPWEQIVGESLHTGTTDFERATDLANGYAQMVANKTGKQVRWEFAHIGQGHYLYPVKNGKVVYN